MRYNEATDSVEFLNYVLTNWRAYARQNGGICNAIADVLKQLERVEAELKSLKDRVREQIYDR